MSNVIRQGDFKVGGTGLTDARSVNTGNSDQSSNEHIEQMRQKLGTEFTGDVKRHTGKKRNELGKDDFMKLMSAQLKYQDPVSPMKNEQMAAQLAQFSALEQMMNVNSTLEKMVSGQKPSEHMMAASLIGKRVTTDKTHFQLEKGEAPEIGFALPDDATSVNVAVVSAKGEVVREFELGEMQKGQQSVRWDGKNGKGQDQPIGEYSYKISAMDSMGKPMNMKVDSAGIVTGVTFEGGKSLLIVDGKKIPIESVGQIEADTQGQSKAIAQAVASAGAGATAADPAAPAKSLAAEAKGDKQNQSTRTSSATQPAKNSLPDDLSPEKIKTMLASMGMTQDAGSGEEAVVEDEGKAPMPLWNPVNN